MYRNTTISSCLSFAAFSALMSASVVSADPESQCYAAKLKESARYASCRLRAEAKGVTANVTPRFAACETRFQRFSSYERRAGSGICPTEGDEGIINGAITRDTSELAVRLGGGIVEECPIVCEPKAQQPTMDTFRFEDCLVQIALDPCSGVPGDATVVEGGCYVHRTEVENLQLIINGTPQPVTIANGWVSSGSASCTTRFYGRTSYMVCTCTSPEDPSPPCA